jgi:hypothetical protein
MALCLVSGVPIGRYSNSLSEWSGHELKLHAVTFGARQTIVTIEQHRALAENETIKKIEHIVTPPRTINHSMAPLPRLEEDAAHVNPKIAFAPRQYLSSGQMA